eukprot:741925-Rhodomonas_salina.1
MRPAVSSGGASSIAWTHNDKVRTGRCAMLRCQDRANFAAGPRLHLCSRGSHPLEADGAVRRLETKHAAVG